jgi:hypothetical protein
LPLLYSSAIKKPMGIQIINKVPLYSSVAKAMGISFGSEPDYISCDRKQSPLYPWVAQKMCIAFSSVGAITSSTQRYDPALKDSPLDPRAAEQKGIRFQVPGKILAVPRFVPKSSFSAKDLPLYPSVAESMGILFVGEIPLYPSVAKSMGMSLFEIGPKPTKSPTVPCIEFPIELPLYPEVAKLMGISFGGRPRRIATTSIREIPRYPLIASAKDLPLYPSVAKSMGILFVDQMPLYPSVAKSMGMSLFEMGPKPTKSAPTAPCIEFPVELPLYPEVAKLMGISFGGRPRKIATARTRELLPRYPWIASLIAWYICTFEMAIPFCGLLFEDCKHVVHLAFISSIIVPLINMMCFILNYLDEMTFRDVIQRLKAYALRLEDESKGKALAAEVDTATTKENGATFEENEEEANVIQPMRFTAPLHHLIVAKASRRRTSEGLIKPELQKQQALLLKKTGNENEQEDKEEAGVIQPMRSAAPPHLIDNLSRRRISEGLIKPEIQKQQSLLEKTGNGN